MITVLLVLLATIVAACCFVGTGSTIQEKRDGYLSKGVINAFAGLVFFAFALGGAHALGTGEPALNGSTSATTLKAGEMYHTSSAYAAEDGEETVVYAFITPAMCKGECIPVAYKLSQEPPEYFIWTKDGSYIGISREEARE